MLTQQTETERAVIDTMTMQLTNEEALQYLRDHGHPIAERTLYNYRKTIRKKTRIYLHTIAGITFEQQHLDRINELLLIKKLMWDAYREEEKPLNQVRILAEIKDIQRYLSAYYEATEDFISDKTIDGYRKKYQTQDRDRDRDKKLEPTGGEL